MGRGEKINHLLLMNDLKLHGKSESEIKGLAATVEVISHDISLEFGIKNCVVTTINRGKVKQSTDKIELPSEERKRYKYLGKLVYDKIKEQEMKVKLKNKYFRRPKLILKSKLNGRNLIMGLNTWAVFIMRYGIGIHKWNMKELQEMDRTNRKFMTTNK